MRYSPSVPKGGRLQDPGQDAIIRKRQGMSALIHKRNEHGFTMAELLVVVAVIAVLVAIAIPVFASQLEKSREAADLANVRSAYAQVTNAAISQDTSSDLYSPLEKRYKIDVDLKQRSDGWATQLPLTVGGIISDDSAHWRGSPKADGVCTVFYDTVSNSAFLQWSGYSLMSNYQWKKEGGKRIISEGRVADAWKVSAITEALSATNGTGTTLNTAQITPDKSALTAGMSDGYLYQIGYFILKPDGTELYDSGRQTISSASENKFNINTDKVSTGENVKIAVQLFKVNKDAQNVQSFELSDAERLELEQLISITK